MRLNDNYDGPFACAGQNEVEAWNNAMFMIDAMEDNALVNEEQDYDDETGLVDLTSWGSEGSWAVEHTYERETNDRGRKIIDEATSDKTYDYKAAMDAWQEDIFEASSS